MKKIVLVLTTMIMALGMQGCSSKGIGIESKDKALNYLNERYADLGDTYTPISYTPSDWSSDYGVLYFRSKIYDDDFKVFVRENGEGNEIEENYYGLYLHEDYENAIKEAMDKVGVDYDFEVSARTTLVNPPLTIEESNEDGTTYDFVCIIFYSDSEYDENQVVDLTMSLAEYNLNGNISYCMNNQGSKEDACLKYDCTYDVLKKRLDNGERIEIKK